MSRVAVIGSGSWGTAATGLVAPHVDEVSIWCRSQEVARRINAERRNPKHLTDYQLPDNVTATSSLEDALSGASHVLLAVPSAHLRATCRRLAPYLPADVPCVILTKGVEPGTGKLMADVVADEVGGFDRLAVLSGPNHAEEICLGMLSAAVVASADKSVAEGFQKILVSPDFRTYVSDDIVGVEMCGAAKNVIAIACGGVAAAGAGDNALAVVMTRGLAEITRLATSVGGKPLTCMGLAGMGDLVATCTSQHSRNRTFGEALVRGETLEQYESRTGMVVEGAAAAASVYELACAKGVEAPITKAIHAILYESMPITDAIGALMERLPYEEFYGIATNE